MSKVFPPHSRSWFRLGGLAIAGLLVVLVAAVWYYATPAYARVGYEPLQPVRFSHKLHAGDLGMDCLYCHNHVDESPHANVPSTQTCMTCHGSQWGNIKATSRTLAPLRTAWEAGRPLPWRRVHRVPGYAYFHHAVHVRRGVSCVHCHGRIDEMETVRHDQPLTMSWCLDCHRSWQARMRPADQVTNLGWTLEGDPLLQGDAAGLFLEYLSDEVGIRPPVTCSGCHR